MMRRIEPAEVRSLARVPVDPAAMSDVVDIIEDIRSGGKEALERHVARFSDAIPNSRLVRDKTDLEAAWYSLSDRQREMLERVAMRIEAFAVAQRSALADVDVAVPGGRAGHRWLPVPAVGAYAPGGRYPLPSTVLMTTIPARVAGVATIWVASPRPSPLMLATAHLGGASGMLTIGGAQAIAALAFGTVSPPCDLIVGPGNKWVTAAKKYLYGEVGIDGLAGPSEILVIADEKSDPTLVAHDLISQAEHDTDARPMLVTTSPNVLDRVEQELKRLLGDLPTQSVARAAFANGVFVEVANLEEAVRLSNVIAAEHVALHVEEPARMARQLSNYGSLFVGSKTAEAFADYGIGPNHVLPTGGTSRFRSGLSVATYLRSPTWTAISNADPIIDDVVALAQLEGLEGHAGAAAARRS